MPAPSSAAARSVINDAFNANSVLNVLHFEIVAEPLARDEFRVVHLGVEPVSYTHLDVYKRQLLRLGRHEAQARGGGPRRHGGAGCGDAAVLLYGVRVLHGRARCRRGVPDADSVE